MRNDDTPIVSPAAHYRHDDGTTEVVYVVEDGTVLTVREYPEVEAFERAVADARYLGEHEGVADLPDLGTQQERTEEDDAA